MIGIRNYGVNISRWIIFSILFYSFSDYYVRTYLCYDSENMNETHQWIQWWWCSHSKTIIGFVCECCSDHSTTGFNISKWAQLQRDHFYKTGAMIGAIFVLCYDSIQWCQW